MAWEVPQRLAGALSLAMTPKSAMGPYEQNPNTAPSVRIQSWQEKGGQRRDPRTLPLSPTGCSQTAAPPRGTAGSDALGLTPAPCLQPKRCSPRQSRCAPPCCPASRPSSPLPAALTAHATFGFVRESQNVTERRATSP